jgi:hypothetical protein|tara:strand:+ start:117 stop:626 length:510 start_codon:yes stop_codon:yes gene_type:complete
MNEYLIILIIPLVFLAWKFYFSIATSEEQQEIEDDKYGDYFLKDIKKTINHLKNLPISNQKNIYENVINRYGRFCNDTWKLEVARGSEYKKIRNKYLKEAGIDRRANITDDGYKNPKWLAATVYETLLFSHTKEMSYDNGKKIRKYIFMKMNELVPDSKNLKLFIKVEG